MYPASSIADLSAVDAAVSAMELQVQSIKDRFRDEIEAIPKTKVLSLFFASKLFWFCELRSVCGIRLRNWRNFEMIHGIENTLSIRSFVHKEGEFVIPKSFLLILVQFFLLINVTLMTIL